MSKALVRRGKTSNTRGLISGVPSLFLPGSGQVLNGEGDKALGMFALWGGALIFAAVGGGLPLLGGLAAWVGGVVAGGTSIVAGADGFIQGRKKG